MSYSSPTSAVARECDSSKVSVYFITFLHGLFLTRTLYSTQVKDAVNFQTRIKLGDSIPIQWIPLKAVGARPVNFKDVKVTTEDGASQPQQKTFFQRYVSTDE